MKIPAHSTTLRRARELSGWKALEVCRRLAVTRNSLRNAEHGLDPVSLEQKLRAFYESVGLEFVDEDGIASVQIRKAAKPATDAPEAGSVIGAAMALDGAEHAIDDALSHVKTRPAEKAERKRRLTRVSKGMKSPE